MDSTINIQKSIELQYLIFKPNSLFIFEIIIEFLLFVVWTFSTFLLLINPNNSFSIFTIILLILMNLILLISWYFIYKLLKLDIQNTSNSRENIFLLLQKEFPKMKIVDDGSDVFIFKLDTGLISWGKVLTIIFSEKNAYVNLTTLGRHDIKSPIHSILNYVKLKKILHNNL